MKALQHVLADAEPAPRVSTSAGLVLRAEAPHRSAFHWRVRVGLELLDAQLLDLQFKLLFHHPPWCNRLDMEADSQVAWVLDRTYCDTFQEARIAWCGTQQARFCGGIEFALEPINSPQSVMRLRPSRGGCRILRAPRSNPTMRGESEGDEAARRVDLRRACCLFCCSLPLQDGQFGVRGCAGCARTPSNFAAFRASCSL